MTIFVNSFYSKPMQTKNETIAAISTAHGTGGIAVIRISGNNAFSIVDSIFRSIKPNRTITEQPAYTMSFGEIINPQTAQVIDETIISVFRAPHSFTGENTVEISCHGSLFIQQEILKLLIAHGCRLATAGEFTQRAFMNGRIDLSQAEAIADLITAQSASAHRVALNQMRGEFSSRLEELRKQLLTFSSLLELELDFADHEDLEFADRSELNNIAETILRQITELEQSFSRGNAIKNGIPVAIVGETNAGKSTLLNLLVGDNRAIVSDIHGTTRDVIEDTIDIYGQLFRFIDTAGLRQTDDIIENLGINRTYEMISRAQIILWVVDSTAVTEHIEWLADRILRQAKDKQVIIILNKIDRLSTEEINVLRNIFSQYSTTTLEISAKHHTNTDTLLQTIYQTAQIPDITDSDTIITNLRHYEALTHARTSITRVIEGLQTQLPADLIAQDIRETLHHLAEITGGEITSSEVLSNIFSKFCIGK